METAKGAKYLLYLLGLIVLYHAATRAGLFLQFQYGGVSPLWPSSGLAVAVLWKQGLRWWPFVMIGEILAGWYLEQPLTAGLAGGTAQLLEAVITAVLLRQSDPRGTMDSVRKTLQFTLYASIGPAMAATLGTFSLYWHAIITSDQMQSSFFTWWLGDVLGIFLVAPLIIAWQQWPFPSRADLRKWLELIALVTLVSTAILVYGDRYTESLFFLLMPLLIIAAKNHGLAGATSIATLLSVMVLLMTRALPYDETISIIRIGFVGAAAFSGYLLAASISELRRTEAARRADQERALATLRTINDGVFVTDADGVIRYLNPTAERLLNTERMLVVDRFLSQVLRLKNEHGIPIDVDELIKAAMNHQHTTSISDAKVLVEQDWLPISLSIQPFAEETHRQGVVIAFRDISEEAKLVEELQWRARHDTLTGLLNRSTFDDILQELLQSSDIKESAEHAMLYIDLDQFKLVNDTCGHEAGDNLLKSLSSHLLENFSDDIVMARLGGDEFGLIMPYANIAQASRTAERIRQSILDFRFEVNEMNFRVGASIGVTVFDRGEDAHEIFSRADVACYMAKEAGRNRIHVYKHGDTEMTHQLGQMQRASQIHNALDHGRFKLYAQPICRLDDIESRQWKQHEILIRMEEGDHLLTPNQFLPFAERFGLLPLIDRWVMEKSFEWLVNRPDFRLSINLSPFTIDEPNFALEVRQLLERFPITPAQVTFEITETVALKNLWRAIEAMTNLRRDGFSFSLDDFGAGVASFGYLRDLPVDAVKLDGRFIKGLLHDPASRIVVESLVKLAKLRNIHTVAEWVENGAVIAPLREIGVEFGQGYHFGKPIPLTDI